jgi:hypothetical protein
MNTEAVSDVVPGIIDKIKAFNTRLKNVELDNSRLELLSIIETHPEEQFLISKLYDEYKKRAAISTWMKHTPIGRKSNPNELSKNLI